ncbi:potassium channel family protein [Photobacterium sp. WH77]|uniref:Two pore domain potassium channel family protein n=1 Tax=Photobacterium arenosum TaxID=2774143 RepID=A0ABR9BJV8_9GAMM|nr:MULTISPECIES: potassium channel family protein [Photobacterium]MBD8511955.1 two pore domain potassium channel family protein [Photobacterium arenosum]MBV7261339.1 two pore domain potassium channel family protein [Photobacterium sp. WH24]MCG2836238.1 potassium channel family protein [Photobacterium sp. WH77]MCG2843625.1 potassium channel family protein [Photobacterium sp. WH80]
MTGQPLAATRGVAVNLTLLCAILLHNLTYPLSVAGGIWPAVFYCFYAVIFVAATWALTGDVWLRGFVAVSGLAVLMAGLNNSYLPSQSAALAVFLTSIVYHLAMVVVLALYTFRARTVMADVVLSATSLYLVIGSGFAAIFALIEWVAPGSFIVSSGAIINWQQMVYYSYITLTTLGYGDITPVGFYAQAVASLEAVIGVLYTVILLSRLVGLYASGRR